MNSNQLRLDPACPADALRPVSGDAGGLLAWAKHRIEILRRYQQRRRAIAELARMSDWRLADLGIPRERIAEVVDGLIAREGPACRGLAG